MRAAKLEPLTPHDLRHTAASLFISAGANPWMLAEVLGHSDTRMIDRVYGHLFERDREDLRKGISEKAERRPARTWSACVLRTPENCDIAVDTNALAGTTGACFEETLFEASTRDQATALRAILEDYPPPEAVDARRPKFRSLTLLREIRAWITRLETGHATLEVDLVSPSEVVRRALDDADALLRTSGPQSAVDRVHTALHGYLLALCADAGIVAGDRPTMNQLFKALRAEHPGFANLGAREDDVARILGSMASILDALNPVRNNASVAHPNDELVGEAEAVLVINTVSTLLTYFESRLRSMSAS